MPSSYETNHLVKIGTYGRFCFHLSDFRLQGSHFLSVWEASGIFECYKDAAADEKKRNFAFGLRHYSGPHC